MVYEIYHKEKWRRVCTGKKGGKYFVVDGKKHYVKKDKLTQPDPTIRDSESSNINFYFLKIHYPKLSQDIEIFGKHMSVIEGKKVYLPNYYYDMRDVDQSGLKRAFEKSTLQKMTRNPVTRRSWSYNDLARICI